LAFPATEIDAGIPPEVAYIARYKPVWYVAGGLTLVITALLVGHVIRTNDYGGWLSWLGNLFQALYVTLTLFLVVLTYKLFRIATTATVQNERIHRISRLPIVVADIAPLAADHTHRVWLTNEGSGPAFDVRVDFDYRPKITGPDGRLISDTLDIPLDANSREFLRSGVIKKEGAFGPLFMDMTPLLIRKPWGHFTLGVDRADFPGDVETIHLLRDYSLVVRISYKDIYGKKGYTTYEALWANGELGFELVQLQPPSIEIDSTVERIHFERRESVEARFDPYKQSVFNASRVCESSG
jgi:hypothetical protein